ncbi:MAG TPA: DUF72 domain-containing protein [Burkholderiales bacterium]|nr:DUF72 domain-containing protein [Burkholderiales bacterium]
MQLLAGTSGFSYKEWVGKFYPEKLPGEAMLRYYAERLPTVEINNTFYRMPAESMLARWAAEVPDRFEFTLKAPRRITHEKRLRESGPDVAEFLRRAEALGAKLGAILFQLPPYLKKDLPRLKDFITLLPAGARIAFEFRNESWQAEDVYATLHERGATLCVTDTEEGDTPFVATSDWAYLRLRRTHYDDGELRAWAERIAKQPLARVYVYFMHEDDALGARFAQRFIELWLALSKSG